MTLDLNAFGRQLGLLSLSCLQRHTALSIDLNTWKERIPSKLIARRRITCSLLINLSISQIESKSTAVNLCLGTTAQTTMIPVNVTCLQHEYAGLSHSCMRGQFVQAARVRYLAIQSTAIYQILAVHVSCHCDVSDTAGEVWARQFGHGAESTQVPIVSRHLRYCTMKDLQLGRYACYVSRIPECCNHVLITILYIVVQNVSISCYICGMPYLFSNFFSTRIVATTVTRRVCQLTTQSLIRSQSNHPNPRCK